MDINIQNGEPLTDDQHLETEKQIEYVPENTLRYEQLEIVLTSKLHVFDAAFAPSSINAKTDQ
jgi:hypothetical protein